MEENKKNIEDKEKETIKTKDKFIDSRPSFFKVPKKDLRSTLKKIFKKKTNN